MEQTLKEKMLERGSGSEATETTETTTAATEPAPALPVKELDERVAVALRAADDKKALNSIVLDLQKVADFTSFFMITSGTNTRQVQAISDGIADELRNVKVRPTRVEGYNTAEWILMDYGDIIIHIFEQKAREFYDLERLWRDARRIPLPASEIKN